MNKDQRYFMRAQGRCQECGAKDWYEREVGRQCAVCEALDLPWGDSIPGDSVNAAQAAIDEATQ